MKFQKFTAHNRLTDRLPYPNSCSDFAQNRVCCRLLVAAHRYTSILCVSNLLWVNGCLEDCEIFGQNHVPPVIVKTADKTLHIDSPPWFWRFFGRNFLDLLIFVHLLVLNFRQQKNHKIFTFLGKKIFFFRKKKLWEKKSAYFLQKRPPRDFERLYDII